MSDPVPPRAPERVVLYVCPVCGRHDLPQNLPTSRTLGRACRGGVIDPHGEIEMAPVPYSPVSSGVESIPCSACEEGKETPACALVAGRWYCLRHLRGLAQRLLEQRDSGVDEEKAVEAVGRALCEHDNQKEAALAEVDGSRYLALSYEDWREEFDAEARVAVEALRPFLSASREPSPSGEKR